MLKKDAQTCIDALYFHRWSDPGAQRRLTSLLNQLSAVTKLDVASSHQKRRAAEKQALDSGSRSRLDSGPRSRGFLVHVSLFLAVVLQLDWPDYLVNDRDWFRFFVVSILVFAE